MPSDRPVHHRTLPAKALSSRLCGCPGAHHQGAPSATRTFAGLSAKGRELSQLAPSIRLAVFVCADSILQSVKQKATQATRRFCLVCDPGHAHAHGSGKTRDLQMLTPQHPSFLLSYCSSGGDAHSTRLSTASF